MGNIGSTRFRVCGSSTRKEHKIPHIIEEEGNNDLETNIVQRNKDNYFDNADYEMILEKYPLFKEWVEQSANAQYVIIKPNQNKIKWREAEVIGKGSYGRVVMGLDLQTGSIMAVKQVQLGNMESFTQQERVKALELEMDLLSRFTHRNIVRYHGCYKDNNTLNIFLEYISGGTIAALLEKYGPFNENLLRLYTRQILEGLEYLHVRNAIHRDIKGANVLVDNNGVCKLADFGTAKRISKLVESDIKGLNLKGTVLWMAPEIVKQTSLTRFCDIWSVGCTVIEMATGKPPWTGVIKPSSGSISTLYQIAQTKSHPPIPKHLSPEAVDFLHQCFRLDPHQRPNVLHLIRHKFVSGVEYIYQTPTTRHTEEKLNRKPSIENGSRGTQVKPIARTDADPKQGAQELFQTEPAKIEEPESKTIKVKSAKILTELEYEMSNSNSGTARRFSHMSSHTIHQTTKPNYTIVPKPLAHANSLKSNKETSTDMESLEYLKNDGNHRKTLSTEPGKEYHVPKGDLKLHNKASLRARLGKNYPAGHFLTEGSSENEEEIMTLQGLTGKGTSSSIITHINGIAQYSSQSRKEEIEGQDRIRRLSSKEMKYHVDNEIVEEEREDQVYSEKAFKDSPERRDGDPFELYQEREEEMSESRDSDREPSMNAASALKVSRISHYGAEASNYGIRFGTGLHDQSSRFSYRREKSMEQITDHGIGSRNKNWKLKSISDAQLPRVELSVENRKDESRGSQKLQEVLYQRSLIKNMSYEKGNKINNLISEDDIILEELKNPKKRDDENNHSKEILDIQDIKKFNLLDDLDKIYNQLDSKNLAL